MAEFFVSYTKSDQAWAEWIANTLEANGFPCVIQAWDFRPGSNFVIEMQEAVRKAERTIVVLSPAYLQASFPAPEWAAAFANDPQGLRRKLVPVRIVACKPEGLLEEIVYIDLVGLDEAAATTTLLNGIKPGRVKPTVIVFPGSVSKFPGSSSTESRLDTAPPSPSPHPLLTSHLSSKPWKLKVLSQSFIYATLLLTLLVLSAVVVTYSYKIGRCKPAESLNALIKQLFSSSKSLRVDAYNDLIAHYSSSSDLVCTILKYANQRMDKQDQHMDKQDQDGIFNAVVLLTKLDRQVLQPESQAIRSFAERVPKNKDWQLTSEQVKKLLKHLQE